MNSEKETARERGLRTYKEYFGDDKKGEEIKDLGVFTIDHLFANIWSRKDPLPMRDRCMITIAILAALGKDDELKRHLKGARHQGISHDLMVEIFIHVAHYAGWPAGHHALKILDDWEEEYQAKPDLKSGDF